MTSAFGGQRSIQLSYGCLVRRARAETTQKKPSWQMPLCGGRAIDPARGISIPVRRLPQLLTIRPAFSGIFQKIR